MDIQLKPERRTGHIAAACAPSLKEQVRKYAKENAVTESAAICYILALFFAGNFGKTKDEAAS